jgi:histidinol dehydrogenase
MNTDVSLQKLKSDIISTLERHNDEAAKEQQTRFDSLSKKLFDLAKQGPQLAQQQLMLQTLLFEEMEQREENIKDAHKTTLNWMFQKKKTKFINWLESEKGIYWVKGKVRDPHPRTLYSWHGNVERYPAKI